MKLIDVVLGICILIMIYLMEDQKSTIEQLIEEKDQLEIVIEDRDRSLEFMKEQFLYDKKICDIVVRELETKLRTCEISRGLRNK